MGFIMILSQTLGRTVHVFQIEYFAVDLPGNISIYGDLLLLWSFVNATPSRRLAPKEIHFIESVSLRLA